MTKIDKIIDDSLSFLSADGNYVGVEIEETKDRLKEISIDFIEWIRLKGYHYYEYAREKGWSKRVEIGDFYYAPEFVSSSELFDLYNNSNKN